MGVGEPWAGQFRLKLELVATLKDCVPDNDANFGAEEPTGSKRNRSYKSIPKHWCWGPLSWTIKVVTLT